MKLHVHSSYLIATFFLNKFEVCHKNKTFKYQCMKRNVHQQKIRKLLFMLQERITNDKNGHFGVIMTPLSR